MPIDTLPLRVVVQGPRSLIDAIAGAAQGFILSPVETTLEISARVVQADVLVVDVARTPGALEAIRELQVRRPVLALVAGGGAARALEAGAAGAIPLSSSPEAIVAAIVAVHAGISVVPRGFMAGGLLSGASAPLGSELPGGHGAATAGGAVSHAHGLSEPARASARAPTDVVLTPREHQVLVRLAEGLSNKEIAHELGVSGHTAKFHVNSILHKLGAQKRVEAVVLAAKRGLIDIQ